MTKSIQNQPDKIILPLTDFLDHKAVPFDTLPALFCLHHARIIFVIYLYKGELELRYLTNVVYLEK